MRLKEHSISKEEFYVLVNDAVSEARNDFEVSLSNDAADNFQKYGLEMFWTDRQMAALKKVARYE